MPDAFPSPRPGGKDTQRRLLGVIVRKRHAFSCESAICKRSTLQQRSDIMAKKTKKKAKKKK
jgi:hypothetical protein